MNGPGYRPTGSFCILSIDISLRADIGYRLAGSVCCYRLLELRVQLRLHTPNVHTYIEVNANARTSIDMSYISACIHVHTSMLQDASIALADQGFGLDTDCPGNLEGQSMEDLRPVVQGLVLACEGCGLLYNPYWSLNSDAWEGQGPGECRV